MAPAIRVVMVLFSMACLAWAMLPAVGVASSGKSSGAGCCFFASFGTAAIAWCVGMIPLGILYLCFRTAPPQTAASPSGDVQQ